jgi:hypothetical protein
MNTIQGKVTVKGSGAGVQDLLIVFYDYDPGTRPEEETGLGTDGNRALPDGDRLGSVLTQKDGSFSISYDDSLFQNRNPQEKRPDLLIMVQAPDEPGKPGELNTLYRSQIVRGGAGPIESYMIQLDEELLAKAGIRLPSNVEVMPEPATNIAQRLKASDVWQNEVIEGSLDTARKRMSQHRARFANFHDQVRPAVLKSLSSLPETVPGGFNVAERFVAPGESVFQKSTNLIKKGIREIVTSTDPKRRPPRRGFITLTDEEVTELQSQVGPDGTIDGEDLAALKERNRPGSTDTVVERENFEAMCKVLVADHEDCVTALELEPTPTPEPPGPVVPGNGVEAITIGDMPKYVARLVDTVTSPEEQLVEGLMPVASRARAGQNIQSLSIKPSPADVAAHHEHSQLQIAFEHVWQEAIDEGILQVAEDAYQTIVELGGEPESIIVDPVHSHDPLGAIKAEGMSTLRAARVVRDHTGDSGPVVRDHRGGNGSPQGGVSVTNTGGNSNSSGPANVRDHRDEVSPEVRLPSLLEELEKRKKEKYKFTIFAANEKERSVNFAIRLVYDQVLTPIQYQAGELVKAIPLAPRQSQKVVVTRKRQRKRSIKEVENNLRAVKEEMSNTNRVEQELAKRTSMKTSFSHTATTDDKMGDSVSSSFTVDAAKSTDNVKKSLQERVFKVTQEIRNERSVTINTEEQEDFESQETSVIENVNDEVLMTLVYFELQRLYKVKVKLVQIQPMVLVAQEMPRPDEIDADWIVAHDWILKRALLDDSYLPILNSVCELSGEETSLAEMKINVDQQRKIVAELREEVAVAKRRATMQSALMEGAVFKRIAKNGGGGGGLFDAVGHFVGDTLGAVGRGAEGLVESAAELIMGDNAEKNAANRQAMQDRADAAADEARELMMRLEREVTALNALMETYGKMLKEYHTRLTQLARFETHVKDNITQYMRAIWENEPEAMRILRLQNTPVPTFKGGKRKFKVDFTKPMVDMNGPAHRSLARFGGRKVKAYPIEAVADMGADEMEFIPLCEAADLNDYKGCFGNYMVFPLRQSNPLTDFMMDPYVDRATGQLMDPSDPSNWTLDEFAEYVCCLKEHLTPEEFAELREELKAQYKVLLTSPQRRDDLLVVPTDSLFVEAIIGEETVMERFKRIHRMEDAKLAQARLRGEELKNLRMASLLLDGDFEDPEIEQKVVIQGNPGGVVVSPQPQPPTPVPV